MFVDCLIAQLMQVYFDQVLVLGPLHDGMGKGTGQQLREAGKNVDTHSNTNFQLVNRETVISSWRGRRSN
jgi:hypothetical protein